MVLTSESVVELLRTLEAHRLFGSLTLNFQNGKVTHADVKQTIKPCELENDGLVQDVLILQKI
jgi:hypothetical protein